MMTSVMRLLLLLLCLVLFDGCKTSDRYDREEMGYLVFVSKKDYAGKQLEVTIDNRSSFAAKVISMAEFNESDLNPYKGKSKYSANRNRKNRLYTVQQSEDNWWREPGGRKKYVPRYSVLPGERQIRVAYEGKAVFGMKVKVESQEKKLIILP